MPEVVEKAGESEWLRRLRWSSKSKLVGHHTPDKESASMPLSRTLGYKSVFHHASMRQHSHSAHITTNRSPLQCYPADQHGACAITDPLAPRIRLFLLDIKSRPLKHHRRC